VRLLLDANLSGRRIARQLREDGHDVLALSEHLELEGLTDPEVLALAATETRILITRNSKDFAPLLRGYAEDGRHHAGSILIWTLGHHEFASILDGIRGLLADRPTQEDWQDIALAI
jgi:uncharacterized protein with PIN domain